MKQNILKDEHMGRLTGRETPHRVFIDGLRWVDAFKHGAADAEAFAGWALRSGKRMEAFAQASQIWNDLSALSDDQREEIECLAEVRRRSRRRVGSSRAS